MGTLERWLIFLLILSISSSVSSCPEKISQLCQCQTWLSGLKLNCVSVNFSDVTIALKTLHSPIYQLKISQSEIDSLEHEDFKALSIQQLVFINNSLTTIEEDAFKDQAESLESLVVAENNLSSIPRVDYLVRLRRLDLSGNTIEEVPEGAFEGNPRLEELRLRHNRICTLPRNALNETRKSLALLDLSENCLRVVPAANIRGAQKLALLDLSNNHITDVPNLQFMNLPELKEVRLSRNEIGGVKPLAFMNVPNLAHLFLNDNNLVSLEPNRFQAFGRLQYLDLSGNRIKKISSSSFKEIPSLEQILLDDNEIESVETLAFSSNPKLRVISIRNNGLGRLFRNAFDSLPKMVQLNLANNSLQSISPGQFSGMLHLQHLNLRENQISSIAPRSFESLSDLTGLDLGGNLIQDLPENAFSGLKKLFWLDICCNAIESFQPATFTHKIANMLLHGNRLECNSSLDWFIDYLVNNNVRTFLPNQEEVTCHGPADKEGMRLKDLMIKKANETFFKKASESNVSTKLPLQHLIPGIGNLPGLGSGILGARGPGPNLVRVSPSNNSTGHVARPTVVDVPGLGSVDLSKVSPTMIRHVMSGGQIPGIPRETLDGMVKQYLRQMAAAAQAAQAANVASPADPSSRQILTTSLPILAKVPTTVIEKVLEGERVEGLTPAERNSIRHFYFTTQATTAAERETEFPPLGPNDLLRLMSREIDLSMLPPQLLQKIAAGEQISLSMVPEAVVARIKNSNPELADRLAASFLSPSESASTQDPLERINRLLRPTGEAPLLRPPPSYDLDAVSTDVANPLQDDGKDQLPLYTGIGLACVGALTLATVAYLCYRRRIQPDPEEEFDRRTFLGESSSPKSSSSLHMENSSSNMIPPVPSRPPPLPPPSANHYATYRNQPSLYYSVGPFGDYRHSEM